MTPPTTALGGSLDHDLLERLDAHLERLLWNTAEADHQRSAIAAINTALAQLRDGSYGTCLGCSVTIEPERLAASPEASTCGECQAESRALIG
jgi:RNA polymerase-binding transcription factor DksA